MRSAPPARYARACGPLALAAIAGIRPEAAARLLWSEAERRGASPVRPGETTALDDIARVLVSRFGRAVEEWTTNRPLRVARDCEAYVRLLRETERPQAPRQPWEGVADPTERAAVRTAVLADRARRRREPPPTADVPPALTIADWRRAFPVTTWLLAVWSEGEGMPNHVIAQRSGRIIAGAGNGRYEADPIAFALRIIHLRGRRP